MDSWQAGIAIAAFAGTLLMLMTEVVHLTIAAMLGAMTLIVLNIMTLSEAISYIGSSYATLALFFGAMVMVRAFEPTKVFDYVATKMVIWARGRGDRLLLGIVAITTPICAVLPNATTVILLAPLLPPMAMEIGVDFIPLLLLIVFVANSAGLLTLVGDPATFIVGNAINISFVEYLQKLSLGGVVSILVLLPLLPVLFRRTWQTRVANLETLPSPQINHPRTLAVGILIVVLVLLIFVIGDSLPVPVPPATAALLGATLSLFLAHQTKIDTVSNILRDVDWSTLIFFMCIFVMIGGLTKTGVINSLSGALTTIVGTNIALGSLLILLITGILSSVVPNIPLLVGLVPLLKQYLVNAGMASADFALATFSGKPPEAVLPLFYAMLFGATLGGNGTLAGAAANIVAAGIAEQHGTTISFRLFTKYGLPVMAVQLVMAATYVTIVFLIPR